MRFVTPNTKTSILLDEPELQLKLSWFCFITDGFFQKLLQLYKNLPANVIQSQKQKAFNPL
jgi:hypothetical protein